jgi:gliding motility-associated-like protein
VNANQSPTAFAGGTVNIVLPTNTTILTGSGSDADGTVDTYQWAQISGPNTPSTQPTGNANELEIDGLVEGQYVFKLTVTDNLGAPAEDQITVVVSLAPTNQPPVAVAGDDAIVTFPNNSITLSGLASTDPDGTIADFAWEQIGTPPATLSDTTFAELQVSDLEEGTYTFALTVTDNEGATSTDQIMITVTTTEENLTRIPKVFTPNGDAYSPTWIWPEKIRAQYDGCELSVYSRFGKKVFEMVSYDNSWDGTFKGSKLEDDAYYYVIKCSDGEQTTGGVRIVR